MVNFEVVYFKHSIPAAKPGSNGAVQTPVEHAYAMLACPSCSSEFDIDHPGHDDVFKANCPTCGIEGNVVL